MSTGTVGGQGSGSEIVKPISVFLGLKPHREVLEKAQKPWLHVKGLSDNQLFWPGKRRKSLASCQT